MAVSLVLHLVAWLFAVGWEEDDEVEEAVPTSKGTLGRLRRREALLLVCLGKGGQEGKPHRIQSKCNKGGRVVALLDSVASAL